MAKSPHNFKAKRNARIVLLVDKGNTLHSVAKRVGLKSVSTVHKIYWRETIRKQQSFPTDAPLAVRRANRNLVPSP